MKSNRLVMLIISIFLIAVFHSITMGQLNTRTPQIIEINDAIELKLVELEITGAFDPEVYKEMIDGDGVHYGKCISITLKSMIDSLVILKLNAGNQLYPADSSNQTMIVTKTVQLPLYPQTVYNTKCYAMCGQMHEGAPNSLQSYSLGGSADSIILRLAHYFDSCYVQNMMGQHALWAYTDKAEKEELIKYGADSLTIAQSQQILTNLNIDCPLTAGIIAKPKPEIAEFNPRYIVYGLLGIIILLIIVNVGTYYRYSKGRDTIA